MEALTSPPQTWECYGYKSEYKFVFNVEQERYFAQILKKTGSGYVDTGVKIDQNNIKVCEPSDKPAKVFQSIAPAKKKEEILNSLNGRKVRWFRAVAIAGTEQPVYSGEILISDLKSK